MRTLVAGWFSFEHMGATAGDLMARDIACSWLTEAGRPFDVAVAPPFSGGIDWRTVEPMQYSDVVFVCGPFGNGPPISEFLDRFKGCRLVGLDVTMLDRLERWNPFDLLLERDSSQNARPDISFLSRASNVPAVGVVLVHPQREYKDRGRHQLVNDAVKRLLDTREVAAVPIDTRLDTNSTGLRTPAEVESLIARMDLVVTTRLHGTVLAIKNGVPVVVIDPIAGGAKVRRQAETIGWPVVLLADELSDAALSDAFDFCRSAEARQLAAECRARAVQIVEATRSEFVRWMASPGQELRELG